MSAEQVFTIAKEQPLRSLDILRRSEEIKALPMNNILDILQDSKKSHDFIKQHPLPAIVRASGM